MRAARWLGVAPWELAERPVQWVHWANMCEAAEAGARKTLSEFERERSGQR